VKRNSWVASVASQTYDFSNNRLIAVIGGGDGTLEEFRRFLFNAGCELTRSIPLGGTTALIEAVSSGF
jgi:uroporphyrinogen-III decarboxylase